jgi:hypothetical protein
VQERGFATAAIIDYAHDGKLNIKQNAWMYAGWTGAGFVAGGLAGGLIQNGGHLVNAEFWGYTVKRAVHRNRSIFGKWFLEKPAPIHLNIKTHFSFGVRVANWVLLDVRFNSKNDNNFQKNFPGRWNINPNTKFRLSLFYFVWRKNSGHYNMMTVRPWHDPNCFFGGYTWFNEHLGTNNTTHKR